MSIDLPLGVLTTLAVLTCALVFDISATFLNAASPKKKGLYC